MILLLIFRTELSGVNANQCRENFKNNCLRNRFLFRNLNNNFIIQFNLI